MPRTCLEGHRELATSRGNGGQCGKERCSFLDILWEYRMPYHVLILLFQKLAVELVAKFSHVYRGPEGT